MIYISLGRNCEPRVYLKNKLDLTKDKGYLTCPFDLCVSSFDSVYNCLSTDFKHFFENLELIRGANAEGDRSKAGNGRKNIKNSYNIIFNHEGSTHSHMFKEGTNDDEYYIRDDFKKFRERYKRRIANFKKYIFFNTDITFVTKDYTKDQNKKLKVLLQNLYKNKNIEILSIV